MTGTGNKYLSLQQKLRKNLRTFSPSRAMVFQQFKRHIFLHRDLFKLTVTLSPIRSAKLQMNL
jgi:hypothetical protein